LKETVANVAPIELLLIDDDDKDIFLTKRAFRKSRISSQIQVARNGEEGLALLRRESPFEAANRPDLIVLDLNMPRMNGHEFLEIVKTEDDLKSIPVIVMTMSQSDADMSRCYQNHANAFMSKPIELDHFMTVIEAIEAFWFAAVRLPQHRDA
jgi:two-component system, chemotaxis family, response regulator Rcp1